MYECYFYVQAPEPDKPRSVIQVMCIECHKKDPQGWYFNGEFGHKKDVICYKCKSIIRKYE
jgi:hypothetical protein